MAALLIMFILCVLLILLIPYYEKIGNWVIRVLTPKSKQDENHPDKPEEQ